MDLSSSRGSSAHEFLPTSRKHVGRPSLFSIDSSTVKLSQFSIVDSDLLRSSRAAKHHAKQPGESHKVKGTRFVHNSLAFPLFRRLYCFLLELPRCAMVYFSSRLGVVLGTFATLASLASAAPTEVTLLVPPFFNSEPAPLTATVLGVDAQGRTTYALNQDEMQGSSTLAPVTGTMVAAADYASYTLAADVPGIAITIGFDCALQNGNAFCTGLDESSKPATATISSLQPLVVDVIATATPQAAGKPSSSRKLSVPILGALISFVLGYHLG
ncbi:hypothetical protein C8F04DRAFT_735001 [Mycena alexandri]|uniref:Uncharacterized protein n=1 Tax=Mycena alexandri TaxID=1745969 RepID=A0AAD6WWQ5_9AGAR|nr:hypothetical protein C8F04DRAFT_735001 [Mycena alexandri]